MDNGLLEEGLVSHIFERGGQAVAIVPEVGYKILIPKKMVNACEMKLGQWYEFTLKSNENPTSDCTHFAIHAKRLEE